MTNISLMGGLGNQLFQLAFGLHLSPDEGFTLKPILANTRRDFSGRPDICSLQLPGRVAIDDGPEVERWLISRLIGRGLRLSTSKSSKLLVRFIEALLFLFSQDSLARVRFADGIGSEISHFDSKGGLYVGYFQSCHFAQHPRVLDELMSMAPLRPSQLLNRTIQEVQEKKPILLHVRLTDYLAPGSFGIPNVDYYRTSISEIGADVTTQELWVFSDAPSQALDFLPEEFLGRYRLAPLLDEAVQNFELMRHFSGYIIANSSFSWWAAQLRRDRSARVLCPWPWFKQELHQKGDFIPNEWVTVASHLK